MTLNLGLTQTTQFLCLFSHCQPFHFNAISYILIACWLFWITQTQLSKLNVLTHLLISRVINSFWQVIQTTACLALLISIRIHSTSNYNMEVHVCALRLHTATLKRLNNHTLIDDCCPTIRHCVYTNLMKILVLQNTLCEHTRLTDTSWFCAISCNHFAHLLCLIDAYSH